MKHPAAAFSLIAVSLCAPMAQAQSVLQRVLLLLESPGMIALNVAETSSPLGLAHQLDPRFAGIDGSISTTIYGLGARSPDHAYAALIGLNAGILAVDLGQAETTAIGGVNTGSIGFAPRVPDMDALRIGVALGVEAALAEAHTAGTQAVAAAAHTLGGSAKTTYLAANMSSNAMRVQGQVTNVLHDVSATMLDIRSTGLGAVNTGAIASGIETTVRGIVGMSGRLPPHSPIGL
ncbi:hypothetical protein [Pseudotabrizicola alkalilacus]|nr:hypothetical protein [Pseudotabrizicola alkalilacus]